MKCLKRDKKQGSTRNGFTFIEVIIALAILSLIASILLPATMYGFRMLQMSSNSRLALANETAMLQIVHASKDGVWFSDGTWADEEIFLAIEDGTFPVYFLNHEGEKIEADGRLIKGGMVRKEDLVLFLTRTKASTVRFEPKMLIEAYSADPGSSTRSVQAKGINTSFDSSITQIEIVDKYAQPYTDFNSTVNNKTTITLRFPVGTNRLRVDKSPYTVTFKTGNENARNLILVEPPYLVAVGGDQSSSKSTILLSADVYETRWWEELDEDEIPETVRGKQLNAVTYNPQMGHFVAVGNQGSVIYSDNGQNWSAVDLPSGISNKDFYDIIYYEDDSTDEEEDGIRFLAVGTDATIIYYPDASGGVGKAKVDVDDNANDIYSVSRVRFSKSSLYKEYKYMAVGKKGTVLYSKNGREWNQLWTAADEDDGTLKLADYDFYKVLFAGDVDTDVDKKYKLKYMMGDKEGKLIGYLENEIYSHEVGQLNEIQTASTHSIRGLAYFSTDTNQNDLIIAVGKDGYIQRQTVSDLNVPDPPDSPDPIEPTVLSLKVATGTRFYNDLYSASIYQAGTIDSLNSEINPAPNPDRFVTAGSDGGVFYSSEILDKDNATPTFEKAEINWKDAYVGGAIHPTIRAIAHRYNW